MSRIHDLIRTEITAGEPDPHQIAKRLLEGKRREVLAALREIAEYFIAEKAREILREDRRGALYRAGFIVGEPEHQGPPLLDTAVWVPGSGWRTHRDLTAADCRLVAYEHRVRADRAIAYADVYHGFADKIEALGVETLGMVGPLEEAA